MDKRTAAEINNLAGVVLGIVSKDAEPPTDDTFIKYGMARVGYQDCLEAIYLLWAKAHPEAARSIKLAESEYVAACDSCVQR